MMQDYKQQFHLLNINIEENNKWLAEKTLQEKVANYSSNYFILASMTTLLSESDKQELLRSRLERIVFQ